MSKWENIFADKLVVFYKSFFFRMSIGARADLNVEGMMDSF